MPCVMLSVRSFYLVTVSVVNPVLTQVPCVMLSVKSIHLVTSSVLHRVLTVFVVLLPPGSFVTVMVCSDVKSLRGRIKMAASEGAWKGLTIQVRQRGAQKHFSPC